MLGWAQSRGVSSAAAIMAGISGAIAGLLHCSHAQNNRFMVLMIIVSTCVLGGDCITCMYAEEG
jgi:hypothetical protein